VEYHLAPVIENGEVDYIILNFNHINYRSYFEKDNTSKQITSLISDLPDIIYRLDTEGKILYINDSIRQFGYDPKDLIGRCVLDLVHPEDRKFTACRLRERRTGERKTENLEMRFITKDQNEKVFELSSTRIEMNTVILISSEGIYDNNNEEKIYLGTIGIARDISERRKAINALKNAKEDIHLLNQLLENMVEGAYLVSVKDGKIVYANQRFEKMFGYDYGEMIGNHVSLINAPGYKDPKKVFKEIQKSLKKYGNWRGEVYNLKKDGTTFWSKVKISEFFHPKFGNVWLSIQEDISDKKAAKEALERSETRYKDIIENQSDFIVRWSPDGKRTFVNNSYCEFFEKTRDQFIGTSFFESLCMPDKTIIENFIGSLTLENPERSYEIKIKRSDGMSHWVKWNNKGIFDSYGQLSEIQSIGRDITEIKSAEGKLLENNEKDKLISKISSDLLNNFEDDITIMIKNALKMVGSFIGSDRCLIYFFDKQRKNSPEMFEWVIDGMSTFYQANYEPPLKPFEWLFNEFVCGRNVIVQNLKDLPKNAKLFKKHLKNKAIKSGIWIPINMNNKLVGVIGCSNVLNLQPINQAGFHLNRLKKFLHN